MRIGVTVIIRKALLLKRASAFLPVFFALPCLPRTELTTAICATVRTAAAIRTAYAIQVKFEETRARCTSHIMPSAAPQSTVITKNSVE